MDNLMNTLFGPMDPAYCKYFYFLSVFAFFSFVTAVLTCLYAVVNRKKVGANMILVAIQSFFGYFVNRLLYSMCVASLI